MIDRQTHLIKGPAGQLEVAVAKPKEEKSLTMVISHPHPLHGGTMQNKVVTTIERASLALGIRAIRYNFRGVGQSEGAFANGVGEQDDLRAVIDWAGQNNTLLLAGFSFGAFVTYHVALERRPKWLGLIGPAVENYAFATDDPQCPCLVCVGEQDEVVAFDAVKRWALSLNPVPTFVPFAETSHFFHGKLVELADAIKEHLHQHIHLK